MTRQHIADEMSLGGHWYHGKLNEPDFLARIIDLNSLPSQDDRYENAYDDIYQHRVNNEDWDDNWIYTDPRINLFHCEDEVYLKFLANTLHPAVRENPVQVNKLFEVFNKHLAGDGFEMFQSGEVSNKPVYSGRPIVDGQANLEAKKAEIRRYLNTDYVNGKINTMTNAIYSDTDLAIGTAKELLETTCKSILRQKGTVANSGWTMLQLLRETTSSLDFKPKQASDPEKAERAIRQILGGIASVVQGVAELRNGYGTGHGKDADFKGLETKYAKLLVGLIAEIAILYLATNGETAELIEE